MLNILPSHYAWLLPKTADIATLDMLALEGSFPSLFQLYPALLYAFGFSIVRIILQEILFKPVAMAALKLEFSNQKSVAAIDELVDSESHSFLPTREVVSALSKSTEYSEQKVRRYIWNKRRDRVAQKKMVKFCEAFWRAVFYSAFTALGSYTLFVPSTAEWVTNTEAHWTSWAQQSIPALMNLYYQLELGCYIHQLYWTEVTRSDAFEMILHHIITIALIVSSFITKFTRIGTSILLVHDCADICLEVGKCFNYTSRTEQFKSWASPLTDCIFGLFVLSFAFTRLVLYPQLVYSLVVEAPRMLGGIWAGYYWYAGLLLGLQALHLFWFYLILCMIYRLFLSGKVEKDVRSDDEADVGEDKFMSGDCNGSPTKQQLRYGTTAAAELATVAKEITDSEQAMFLAGDKHSSNLSKDDDKKLQ